VTGGPRPRAGTSPARQTSRAPIADVPPAADRAIEDLSLKSRTITEKCYETHETRDADGARAVASVRAQDMEGS
jgi:hypothetical protein